MKYLLTALVALEILDGVLTHFLVTGGFGTEANPFLEEFVGEVGFLLLKIAGGFLCAFLLWDIYKRYPKVALITTLCCIVGYSGIVTWNLRLFFIN